MIQNFFFIAFVLLISVSMSSLLHLDANDIDLLRTQYNSNTIFGDDDLNDETVIAKRQGMIPGPRVGRSGMLPGPRVGRSKESDIFQPIAYTSYRMYNEQYPPRISRSSMMIPPPRVGRGITLPGPRVGRSGMLPPPRVGRGGASNLIPGPRIGRGGMIPNARVGRSSLSPLSNSGDDSDFRSKGMMFVMPEHISESEPANNGILHDDDSTPPRHSVSDASIETQQQQQQTSKYHGRSKRSASPSMIATDDEDDNGAWNDDYTSSGVSDTSSFSSPSTSTTINVKDFLPRYQRQLLPPPRVGRSNARSSYSESTHLISGYKPSTSSPFNGDDDTMDSANPVASIDRAYRLFPIPRTYLTPKEARDLLKRVALTPRIGRSDSLLFSNNNNNPGANPSSSLEDMDYFARIAKAPLTPRIGRSVSMSESKSMLDGSKA